jgi:hypothetical protein
MGFDTEISDGFGKTPLVSDLKPSIEIPLLTPPSLVR